MKALNDSASDEVKVLFNIMRKDIQSNTGKNMNWIQNQTGLNPSKVNARVMRNHKMIEDIPEADVWRIPMLDKLLRKKRELETLLLNTDEVEHLINGVCST